MGRALLIITLFLIAGGSIGAAAFLFTENKDLRVKLENAVQERTASQTLAKDANDEINDLKSKLEASEAEVTSLTKDKDAAEKAAKDTLEKMSTLEANMKEASEKLSDALKAKETAEQKAKTIAEETAKKAGQPKAAEEQVKQGSPGSQ